jgi:hypothetical protein
MRFAMPAGDGNPHAFDPAPLRERLAALALRRDELATQVTPFATAARLRALEAMRFELAEVAWQLDELEG